MNWKIRDKRYKRFQTWLDSELAEHFLKAEATAVGKLYARIQGAYLLVVGDPKFSGCVQNSLLENKILVHQQARLQSQAMPLVSRQDKLPVAEGSVSSVYLAHCLEWDPDPHEILREANRVLRPEGDLIITGFNPWSLWGGVYYFRPWFRKPAWGGILFAITKLKDWLGLLGFDILKTDTFFFRPPIRGKSILEKLAWLESAGYRFFPKCGGGFVIRAKKRIIPLTPIKPEFVARADLLPEGAMDLRVNEEI